MFSACRIISAYGPQRITVTLRNQIVAPKFLQFRDFHSDNVLLSQQKTQPKKKKKLPPKPVSKPINPSRPVNPPKNPPKAAQKSPETTENAKTDQLKATNQQDGSTLGTKRNPLPFVFERSATNHLPVYTKYMNGRTKEVTVVRKYRGDVKV
jgi:hypothetical protein